MKSTDLTCAWCGMSLKLSEFANVMDGELLICDKCLTDSSVTEYNQHLHPISCCQWCGKSLENDLNIKYLNGNQACCDLCFTKAELIPDPGETGWVWRVDRGMHNGL